MQRAAVLSLAVHVAVLWVLLELRTEPVRRATTEVRVATVVTVEEAVIVDVVVDGGGGGGSVASAAPASAPRRVVAQREEDAWQQIAVSMDGNGNGSGNGNGNGNGNGDGDGNGDGNGIGFGNGGGVRVPDELPPAPPPPSVKVSRARPAKLIFPTRDRDVEDEADLFVAKVTVDADGDVVGARMIKTRPGARGEHASNAIWSFRYLPALNDDGLPIATTFEQPFQIR